MKKLIALLLALTLCLPVFCGCAEPAENTLTETAGAEDKETKEAESKTEEEKTPRFLEFDPKNPEKLSAEKLSKLPIASDDLTPAQLRQLAVDYFELQLSFLWKTNFNVTDYPTTYAANTKKTLTQKYLYSGIPYQSQGTGNLYRWLEYYDPETGVMDLARALQENGGYGEGAAITTVKEDESGNTTYKRYRSFMALFNQCSIGSFWGWGRVINSAHLGGTAVLNVYSGLIPVGGYTYPNMEKIDRFGTKTDSNPTGFDTKDVIEYVKNEKGKTAMMDCYLKCKPGDCLVSGGHTMMVSGVKIVRKSDGSVNYTRSYVSIHDQGEAWSKSGKLGDTPWLRQGGVSEARLLNELEDQGYIPFTFREFQDPEDELDQKHIEFYNTYIKDNLEITKSLYSEFNFSEERLRELCGEGVEKSEVFLNLNDLGDSISFSQLQSLVIGTNYPISDLFVTVTDQGGNVLKQNIYRSLTSRDRQITLNVTDTKWEMGQDGNYKTVLDGIRPLANGANKITLTLQISTGEKHVVLEKTLTA